MTSSGIDNELNWQKCIYDFLQGIWLRIFSITCRFTSQSSRCHILYNWSVANLTLCFDTADNLRRTTQADDRSCVSWSSLVRNEGVRRSSHNIRSNTYITATYVELASLPCHYLLNWTTHPYQITLRNDACSQIEEYPLFYETWGE